MRRSRFVTAVARARDPSAARDFVSGMAHEHADASHVCWAFAAGPPGDTARVGMSDAGEPRGTAGRPMLSVLLHSGIGEVVAVCARYYGGVKLGRGGLVRAYAGGVKSALDQLATELRIKRIRVVAEVTYDAADSVRRTLDAMEAKVVHEEFGERVRLAADVPLDSVDALTTAVANLTGGSGAVTRVASSNTG